MAPHTRTAQFIDQSLVLPIPWASRLFAPNYGPTYNGEHTGGRFDEGRGVGAIIAIADVHLASDPARAICP